MWRIRKEGDGRGDDEGFVSVNKQELTDDEDVQTDAFRGGVGHGRSRAGT